MFEAVAHHRREHNEVARYVKYSVAKRSGKRSPAGEMRLPKADALGGRAGNEHDRSGAEGVPCAEGGCGSGKGSGA